MRLRRDRGQSEQTPHRCREQDHVRAVRRGVAAPGDQESGQQRADRERNVEREDGQRIGCRKEMACQQSRVDGRAGGADHREPGAVDSHQEIENQRVGVAQPGLHHGEDAGGPHDRAGHEGDDPSVVRVDQRTAIQTHDDDRHECEQTHQPDRERRPGQLVDLQPDRHHGELTANAGEGETGVQPAVCRAGPQRGEVQQDRHAASLEETPGMLVFKPAAGRGTMICGPATAPARERVYV